jgi:beta-N-acetylhexosaminidase
VVDVNVNPASPAIGGLGRSFSSDAAVVTAFAQACVAGHRDAGILTCVKHFPGHGSARGDTHEGYVDVTDTWTEAELVPYVELMATNSIDALMLSHVIHSAFTNSKRTPVSLSPRAIRFVRSDLGYAGPIVSDDLQMGAIAREMSDEEAAVAALEAGNDLLIFANFEAPDPELGRRVNAALVRSVVDGQLRGDRLMEAAMRVKSLRLKVH